MCLFINPNDVKKKVDNIFKRCITCHNDNIIVIVCYNVIFNDG